MTPTTSPNKPLRSRRRPKERSPSMLVGVLQAGALLAIVAATTYAASLLWYGVI